MDAIDFTIEEDALNYIVEKAVAYKLGARGLRSLCEAIFTDAMFELPSAEEKVLKVTKAICRSKINKYDLKKVKSSFLIRS